MGLYGFKQPNWTRNLEARDSIHHVVTYRIAQWEFQDPKLEIPTIYKAYVRAM